MTTHALFTGGTICCDDSLTVSDKVVGEIKDYCRSLGITSHSFPIKILSEQATADTWVALADHINSLSADKIIILHGSDTMTYSLNAIDMLVSNKTIVFTGSMAPWNITDQAKRHLKESIQNIDSLEHGTYLVFSESNKSNKVLTIPAASCLQERDGYFSKIEASEPIKISNPHISKTSLYLAQPNNYCDFSNFDKVIIVPYHSNTFNPNIICPKTKFILFTDNFRTIEYNSVANLNYKITYTKNIIRSFIFESLTK